MASYAAALALPIGSADPHLARHAENSSTSFSGRLSASSISDEVGRVDHDYLSKSITTIEYVLARLGLHPRTLQRLLVQEGTTHADVLDDAPRSLASHYLSGSDRSILDIAIALGYSTTSAFSPVVSGEFGQPTASWRRASAAYARPWN